MQHNTDTREVLVSKHTRDTDSCRWLISGVPLVGNLRTRLLALHVLEAVLPACEANMEDDQMSQVCHYENDDHH